MNTYIQGGVIVAPDNLWGKFWDLVRNNMFAINKVGLSDDDQVILLMSYRENKELFEIHESNRWFSAIADCSYNKFTIKEKNNIKERKIKKEVYKIKRTIKYLLKWFNILKKAEIKE